MVSFEEIKIFNRVISLEYLNDIISWNFLNLEDYMINNDFFVMGFSDLGLYNPEEKIFNYFNSCDWIGHFNLNGSNQIITFEDESTGYMMQKTPSFGSSHYEIKEDLLWSDLGHFEKKIYFGDLSYISDVSISDLKNLIDKIHTYKVNLD